MLVLSRKKGQSIVIGDSIEITVVDVQGDMVRIGINAPREITVHRQEVFQQIKAENQQALQQSQGLEIKLRQLTELSKNIDKKDKHRCLISFMSSRGAKRRGNLRHLFSCKPNLIAESCIRDRSGSFSFLLD